MFRRRAQRIFRGLFKQDVPSMLQRANQLMASGDYAGAAIAFKELAEHAEDRFPQRTPILYMEAGRAAILGGDAKNGVSHLRRGLTLLASQGRLHRMQVLGQRAVTELTVRGLNAEAGEIAELMKASLPKEPPTQPAPVKRPVLPTHCPSCGGTVRSDEIEWLDDSTAECDYCGSPLRGE